MYYYLWSFYVFVMCSLGGLKGQLMVYWVTDLGPELLGYWVGAAVNHGRDEPVYHGRKPWGPWGPSVPASLGSLPGESENKKH